MWNQYTKRYTGDTVPYGATPNSSQCLLRFAVWGPTVLSLDLPLLAALGITGTEREATCYQLNQQGEAWATKAQQDWPVKVALNSRLLDMQGTRGLMGLRTQQQAVDP
jgi:hypothetical protein